MDTNSKTLRTPLVSVIMLTYNRASYIRLAINSALSQTYQNFELIILDDGSTDTTKDVVSQYNDRRIRYIKDHQNKGLFVRRQESLSHIQGEFVAILDSDDIWLDQEKLVKQVGYMEKHPECALVGTFVTLIDRAGNTIGNSTYNIDDATIRKNILTRNQFANSSVLMRTAHLRLTAGYRDFAPCEDLELFLQLGEIGGFANLPEYMLAYRVHAGGESAHKVKVARQVLRLVALHRHHYPGYWRIVLKMNLLIILAKLGLK